MACKEYDVEVSETLSRIVKVTAESEAFAIAKVANMYRCCEIVLDAADCVGWKITLIKEENDYDR